MRHQIHTALLLGLSTLSAAVFQDEVGDIDFHHSLVGVPQVETTFFHQPRKDDKANLLYTLSDIGVIGAVNPTDGNIVWRQQISDELTNGGGYLRAPDGESWVAAAHGRRVHAWDALNGRSIWQAEFTGAARDLEIMELTEGSRKDVLVLFEEGGTTVLRRLNGELGTVIWEFRETSKDIPLQISNNIANVYVISLHGSQSAYSVKTTSLDPATGTRVDQWTVGTKGDVHDVKDVMFVGANSAAPILAWTSSGNAKLNVQVLGTKSKQEFPLAADTVEVNIHAPHQLQSLPHFLVHSVTKTGNKAEVYHTDLKTNQISKAFDLPHLPGHGAFSTSSDKANVYFTRVTEDELSIVSSESHAVLAKWPLKPDRGLKSLHSVSEVIRKGGNSFAVRSAVVTESDDWFMIRNGETDWERTEGLTGAVAAVWAEIPEAEELAKVLAEEAHTSPISAYIHRVQRHIGDLKYLPGYIMSLPVSFANAVTGKESFGQALGLHPDSFGFNKIIVLATRRGRLFALDSGKQGKVIWSKNVLPQATGESLNVKGLAVQDDNGVVVLRGSKGESVLIRATDGHVLDIKTTGNSISTIATIFGETKTWLLPLNVDGAPSEEKLAGQVTNQTIVIRGEGESVKGIKLVQDGKKTTKQEIWQIKASLGQEIADIATQPSHNPVASIGRVLADRGVSYKYLNPNTIVVALIEKTTSALTVRLVDTVSGEVLASERYSGVDPSKTISCTIAENWYACSFFGDYILEDGSNQSIKGYQIAVSDLYESSEANDRGPLGDTDKFSSLEPVDSPTQPPLPYVQSQTWIISQPLTQLSVTQTRQGISSKEILAYLPESHSVLSLPRVYVDPRRPIGRDPTAAEMEAEGLPKYTPAIEIDSRSIVSHGWDILGVQGFVAAPALVESTSMLVAYGVDVYGTRISPSGTFDILGKGFNKVTMLITVWALFTGVVFLAPMVRRKQIDRRWEAYL